ncbi:MAG: multiheme c-type cytochrome, partial [Bacteroidota bacterium]
MTRLALFLLALVSLTGGLLWATDSVHPVYALSILLHPALGLGMVGLLVFGWKRLPQQQRRLARVALAAMTLTGGLAGVVGGGSATVVGGLTGAGVGAIHGVVGFLAGAGLLWVLGRFRTRAAQTGPSGARRVALRTTWGAFGVALLLPALFLLAPANPDDTITNPILAPATMEGEAMGGADGPFFPSAAKTAHEGLIEGEFFLDSEGCGRSGCHEDVTAQWNSSAHHLSSFNNQWYRKSIEYMQEVVGPQKAQWCAGCHDHALLYSGQMNQPVEDFIDTPEAHAGLGCVSCHSAVAVDGTMGNGGLTLAVPPMHDLAVSDQPLLRALHDLTLHLDPAPHREAFLRPFHREQASEFCSSCHKVHLDEAVNGYRWVRGFNTYDNWQASGVSGQGARSFYAPPSPQTCVSCHMPEVPSDDAGNRDGYVRSHAFLAANTALPTAYGDTEHLLKTTAFLKAGQLTLDLFAASLPEAEPTAVKDDDEPRPTDPTALATTFAIGEEQGMTPGSGGVTREATPVLGALSDGETALVAGTTTRLDLVVRTRGLGHFFPTGTVDAQEAWVELRATDATGRTLLLSGDVDEGGTVDPSAHFYRNLMVDGHGNPIDKRNAFAARATVYVNLIPPGAADVVHYRLAVPDDVVAPVTVAAALHYRKFTDAYTRFAYGGLMKAGAYAVDYDDRTWTDGPVPDDVAGVV